MVTWNNGPTTVGNNNPFNATLIENVIWTPPTPSLGDKIEFSSPNLVSVLNNNVGSDRLITFILEDSVRALRGASVASKENPNFDGPMLSISTVPVPTALVPMTIGLSLMGLLAIKRQPSRKPAV
jgi:hypothetical protein